MITCTVRLEFDYGHRVLGHTGRCRHLHGHRGAAEVTVTAARLDGLGMVIDFGTVKEKVKGWIDDNWDHNMVLHPDDPALGVYQPTEKEVVTVCGQQAGVFENVGLFHERPAFVMPAGQNPTAENMAAHLFHVAHRLLDPMGVTVVQVRLWETPNSSAAMTRSSPK